MCVFFSFFVLLPFCHFAFFSFIRVAIWTGSDNRSLSKPPSPELRRLTQATVLPGILNNLGKVDVCSVQFLHGGSFRASFSISENKVMIENIWLFNIGKHQCTVQATGPPQLILWWLVRMRHNWSQVPFVAHCRSWSRWWAWYTVRLCLMARSCSRRSQGQ